MQQALGPAADLFDESGVIRADVSCRRCGYNLRGLRADGRCPECGTPIGLSTHGDLLRFADPTWVEKLALGIKYIIWGLVISVIVGTGGGCLGASAGASPAVVHVIALVGGLVGLYGAWLLTAPDPSGIGEDRYVTARRVVRIALLVGLVSQCLQTANATVPNPPRVLTILFLVLAGLAGVVGAVGEIAKYLYLEKLAGRIPHLALARQCRFLAWALGISLIVGVVAGSLFARSLGAGPLLAPGVPAGPNMPSPAAAPGGTTPAAGPPAAVAPPRTPGAGVFPGLGIGFGAIGAGLAICAVGIATLVFSIMALILQIRLGRRFREQAASARQTWAAIVAGGPPPPPPASPLPG